MYALNECPTIPSAGGSERASGAFVRALSPVESRFVENWGGLSRAFGMGETTGRVHAVLFLAGDALSARDVADLVDVEVHEMTAVLERLVEYGAVEVSPGGESRGRSEVRFTSVADPWTWFSSTIRQRARSEFAPLLQSIRGLQEVAEQAHRSGHLCDARFGRITRFSRFVDQVAKLLETFGGAGSSRPVLSAARTMARFICG